MTGIDIHIRNDTRTTYEISITTGSFVLGSAAYYTLRPGEFQSWKRNYVNEIELKLKTSSSVLIAQTFTLQPIPGRQETINLSLSKLCKGIFEYECWIVAS